MPRGLPFLTHNAYRPRAIRSEAPKETTAAARARFIARMKATMSVPTTFRTSPIPIRR
jgi:hypothetical protein